MEKLQCSVCGGALVMSDDGEKAVCESCGMSFKKETVKKMIMELSGPVKVEGIQNSDSLADRAETFLRLGETEKAHAAFRQMTDEYPADYRGWWGLTRLMDWEKYFYDSGTGEADMPLVCKRALEFALEEAKKEIQDYFSEKVSTVKTQTDQRHRDEQAAAEEKRRNEQAAEEEYQKKLRTYENALEEVRSAFDKAHDQFRAEEEVTKAHRRELDAYLENISPGVAHPIRKGNLIALVIGCVFAGIALFGVGVTSGMELLMTISFVAIPLGLLIFRICRCSRTSNRIDALKQAIAQSEQKQDTFRAQRDKAGVELEALRRNAPVR